MYLTPEEQKMCEGTQGEVVAEAMNNLIKLGEAFGAEKMVDIIYVHHPAEMSIYKGQCEDIVQYANRGAKVVVPTTTTTLACDVEQWHKTNTPRKLAEEQITVLEAHKKMGMIPTYTCVPYILGFLPPKGSYIVSTESSAIIYFNSVLGAKTNRGGYFTRFSEVTGKYPYMGYLLDENRKGTHLAVVDVPDEMLKEPADYSALGFYVGDIVGSEVPVFTRIGVNIQENLIALGASLATSGSVTLYHIIGITPEAPTLEFAFGNSKSRQEIYVGEKEMRAAYEKLTTAKGSEIDFVCLGCPHYNPEQIRVVAGLLDGKKVSGNVRFWIYTSRMAKRLADWAGYTEIIERAGALLLCDTCPVESHMRQSTCLQYGLEVPNVRTMVVDSAKQARYVRDLIGCETVFTKMEDCVRAAITGRCEV